MVSVTNDLEERRRRQRQRNRALLIVLGSLAVLFYVIGMIKFGGGH